MIYYIESLLKAIIVVWSACLFFRIFEHESDIKKQKKSACMLVAVIGLFLCGFLPENLFWIRVVMDLAILTFAMFLCWGMEFRNTVYLTVYFYVFVLFGGYVAHFLTILLHTDTIAGGMILQSLVSIGGMLLLFPLVYLLKRMMTRKPSMYALRNEWFAFSFVSVLFLIAFLCVTLVDEQPIWCSLLFVLGLSGCNIGLFYIFSDLIKKQKLLVRERILKTGLEHELDAYKTIHQALEQQRSRSHEFKNYINAIYYMIELKKYDEVTNLVQSVRDNMHTPIDEICHTDHLLADAILNAKYKEALVRDIHIMLETDSLKDLFVKDEDVVVIFSNLLNNALEAAEKCESDRYIFMRIKREGEGLRILIENSHCNVIRSQGGILLTSKEEDRENHGVGIQNIKNAVEKYNGICDISHTDKKFAVNIFLHAKS